MTRVVEDETIHFFGDANISDIEKKVVIFSDGRVAHFYGLGDDGNRTFWTKAIGDHVEESKATYTVENGVVYIKDENGNNDVNITFYDIPLKTGSLAIATNYSDSSINGLVVRKVFGYHGSKVTLTNAVNLTTSAIEDKVLEFTNSETYTFYKDGLFKIDGLSYLNNRYYENYGTWEITGENTIHLTYVYGTIPSADMQLNELPAKGTRSMLVNSDASLHDGIIKNVIPVDPDATSIDAYPEYQYKAVSNIGGVTTSLVDIDGISYTIIAYSKILVDNPDNTQSGETINVSFYGQSANRSIAGEYAGETIVLKIFNGSKFVGSFGPFEAGVNSSAQDLGNQPFNR